MPTASFVFLVFDRDTHEHFADTLAQVSAEDRVLAFVSIPSIEFFFLLHAEMTTASFATAEEAIQRLKTHQIFSDYEKKRGSVRVAELSDRSAQAYQRAAAVRKHRAENGSDNPYTDMDVFAELISHAKKNGLDKLVGLKDSRLFS